MNYKNNTLKEEIQNVLSFGDFENAKQRLAFKLINVKQNKKLLEDIPHRLFLDLAVVYYLVIEKNETGVLTAIINNEHMLIWKISEEELYQTALKNYKKLFVPQLYALEELITESLCDSTPEYKTENLFEKPEYKIRSLMYVLTNDCRTLGAAGIIYPDLLEQISNLLDNDFYILSSSVHECLIVPYTKSIEKKELDTMIKTINKNEVNPKDILENHSYLYQRIEKKILY